MWNFISRFGGIHSNLKAVKDKIIFYLILKICYHKSGDCIIEANKLEKLKCIRITKTGFACFK